MTLELQHPIESIDRSIHLQLRISPLDLTKASGLRDAGDDSRSRSGRSDILALEVGDEVRRANRVEFARASEGVDLASTAQSRRAGGAPGIGSEDLATRCSRINGVFDILEHVSLRDYRSACADLEGVTGVGVPVVVDGVQEGIAADLGAAAAGVVDVVAFHRDHVVA